MFFMPEEPWADVGDKIQEKLPLLLVPFLWELGGTEILLKPHSELFCCSNIETFLTAAYNLIWLHANNDMFLLLV